MKNKAEDRIVCSDYKHMIIKIVEKIENPATLKFILSVIESYLKSRGV